MMQSKFSAAYEKTSAELTPFHDRIAQTLEDIEASGKGYWDNVDFLDSAVPVTRVKECEAVRFCGHVTKISDPYMPGDLASAGIMIVDVGIADHTKRPIVCWPLDADPWHEILQDASESGSPLEFYGFIGMKPIRDGKKFKLVKALIIMGIHKVTSLSQRMMAQKAEIATAQATIKANPNMLSFLRKELIKRIGITGIDRHPKLSLALDFLILQALAFGMVDNNPGRLHSLAYGPPGVGKKLLSLEIKILNPNWTEGNAAKLTVAGAQARAYRSGSTYRSEPGLIPLADQSTFIVQDAHGVKDKAGFFAVLSMTMEDGELMDSTAAKTRMRARTAIHLDLNKKSDLDPTTAVRSGLDDMGMKMHVLSRFDFIVEFDRDPDRQKEILCRMLDGNSMVGAEDDYIKPTHRDLKILVAVLRDANEVVLIPKWVNAQLRLELEALLAGFEHPLLSDLLARMTISAKKFAAAQARMCQRSVANLQDVTSILPFLEEKLQILKSMAGPIMIPLKAKGQMRIESREKWILSVFAGQTFSVNDVVTKLREAGETGTAGALEQKVLRDLRRIAVHKAHGQWEIPGDPANPGDPDDPTAMIAA